MSRQNVSGNSPFEPIVGYSRAVRVGNVVHVAGTTATGDDGALVGKGDAYAQTVQIFKNVARALERAGASMRDVVRTRMFVTDITRAAEVIAVHGEVFGAIRPAATMVEVSALIEPSLLIEIEAEAVRAGRRTRSPGR